MAMKIKLDLAFLENLAAAGASQKKAAEAMNIKPGTLFGKISTDAEVRAAWERGKARLEGTRKADMSDDDRVLDAIRHGHRTAADIKRHTGLKNGAYMDAIERLEVNGQIKSRDEHMLTHYYLAAEPFPPIEKPAGVPAPPVSTALVSSSRHSEVLERITPDMKNVTPASNGDGNGAGSQPAELDVVGRAVEPLPSLAVVDDALRGLQVEHAYFDYHGVPSPTMSAVLSKVEGNLRDIRQGVAS